MSEQEKTKPAVTNVTEDQDQEEEPDDGVPIVLVTGASGFVATHLIKQLLEQGRYCVRGTVRNKKQQEKVVSSVSTLCIQNYTVTLFLIILFYKFYR